MTYFDLGRFSALVEDMEGMYLNRYMYLGKKVINSDVVCIITFFLINDVMYLMTC